MKKYLLDTCILSEFSKINSNDKVIKWISSHDNYCTSIIVIGEIMQGINKIKDENRKKSLQKLLNNKIKPLFADAIFDIDNKVITKYAEIQAQNELRGNPKPVLDTLIVATAVVHNCIIITRNVKDMQNNLVEIINPYK